MEKYPRATATALFDQVIKPAIDLAGLEVGASQLPESDLPANVAFEQLALCDFAVVDVTWAAGKTLYDLGVREAVRPGSTVFICQEPAPTGADVGSLNPLPYHVNPQGLLQDREILIAAIVGRLLMALGQKKSGNVFELWGGSPDIARLVTDVFRDRMRYSSEKKAELDSARKRGLTAIREFAHGLEPFTKVEAGVLIDLFLSYRSVKAWQEMIELTGKMPLPLRRVGMVRQQQALALNRLGRSQEAIDILETLLAERGPSSETFGLLGRVYKDRWETAKEAGDLALVTLNLDKAIDAYLKGFETDWRDAYPGVNALTLMELRQPPDPRRTSIMSAVVFAVNRRLASSKPDYWDNATWLELAVLENVESEGSSALAAALSTVREKWEAETTARNLRLIREARQLRNDRVRWAELAETRLNDLVKNWPTKQMGS